MWSSGGDFEKITNHALFKGLFIAVYRLGFLCFAPELLCFIKLFIMLTQMLHHASKDVSLFYSVN